MKIKRILKKVIAKMSFLFVGKSHLDTITAESVLQSFSSDPSTTCVASNTLDIQYDLQIIIPAYNAEKYVGQCLESALNQKTEYSYLVTIVNDGSTDQTLKIMQSFQKKFANMFDKLEIINQKNKGFSGARNTAMKILKGKYITFLDSDDVLVDGAVDAWLNAAKDGDYFVDIVQGRWYEGVELNAGGGIDNIKDANGLSGFPWGKIFKAEILQNFQFPEGYWFEDTPISFMLYGKGYSFKNISDVVYGYRLNPEGITAKCIESKRSVESFYITALCLREFPLFNISYDQRAYEYFLNQCIMNLNRISKQPKEIREAVFVLQKTLREKYFNGMHSDINKEIETALKKKQFRRFEILIKTKR